jgi:hypothetical protein
MYDKDIVLDKEGKPVIAYLTSGGHKPGPSETPHTFRVAHWNGKAWDDHPITTTDHNYDSMALDVESDDLWHAIAPTEPGPEPYGTGGEMCLWTSADRGDTWKKSKQLTSGSKHNHTYARRPVNAHPDFYALWADGNARAPSDSSLYFCTKSGNVYRLPRKMSASVEKPELISAN